VTFGEGLSGAACARPLAAPGDQALRRSSRRFATGCELLGLAALWGLLYLPWLGFSPLEHEEGRRLLPAREMLASGDFVLPTLFGRAYLAKPPLAYWLIDLASLPAGQVTAWSTRIPSALAVLGLAGLVHALASRFIGRGAARLGVLLWLLMPMALEKGVLGELEAPFALFVGLALAGQFAAAQGRPRAALLGGLALGLAVLTKGPAAWVFSAAAGVGSAALEPRRARAHLAPMLVCIGVSVLIAAAWVVPLVSRLGWATLQSTWLGEASGGGSTPSQDLGQRAAFAAGTAAGFLPASALLLALAPRSARRAGLPALVRFALVVSAGACLFFLVYPRCQARYAFPAAPWTALAGGYVLARGLAPEASAGARRALMLAAGACALLGPAAALALLADRLALDFTGVEVDALGVALALAAAAAGALALAALRRGAHPRALAASLAVLVLVRGLHLSQVVRPDARAGASADWARAVAATLPGEGRIHTAHWSDFNLLATLPRPPVYTEAPLRDVAPGEVLLYARPDAEPVPAEVARWEALGAFPLRHGKELVAVQRPRLEMP